MKTKKLRILIAQIVWQRSVGSLFPLQNLKIFFPSDLMYTICACEICWDFVFFVILNLFKYFVDVFFDLLVLVHIAESMSLSWAVPMKPLILELFCG